MGQAALWPVRVGDKLDTLYAVSYFGTPPSSVCNAAPAPGQTRAPQCVEAYSIIAWSRRPEAGRLLLLDVRKGETRVVPYGFDQVHVQWWDPGGPTMLIGQSGVIASAPSRGTASCGTVTFTWRGLRGSCTVGRVAVGGDASLQVVSSAPIGERRLQLVSARLPMAFVQLAAPAASLPTQ
ncbi:MAG: hypothetical protein IT359_15560 [Gemmatimonadaceae bacterium]|nr:hypothetical protein [Gemmatimonadaceae bacterium]